MGSDEEPTCVVQYAISKSKSEVFTLENAKPRQYRFLDCQHFLNKDIICILAFSSLPTKPYAAVSHVWRDLESTNKDEPSFAVYGLESEAPIAAEPLRIVCKAAIHFNCPLLWLDKLCVRQDSRKPGDGKIDNEWQIQNMHAIYANSSVCLVMPGGMRRLARLDEKTKWIERAWTLQESLAPKDVYVVFEWDQGSVILQHNASIEVKEVVEGKAAVVRLKALLEGSLKSQVRIIKGERYQNFNSSPLQTLRVLGNPSEAQDALFPIMALLGAMEHDVDSGRLNAIWRCTILRSAKYHADMIYSIMGLMGVMLKDVDSERDSRDVVIEFTRALTDRGMPADWLGIAPSLGPSLRMSTMPLLPLGDEDGVAYKEISPGKLKKIKTLLGHTRGNNTWYDDMWWWLKDVPVAKVDEAGYLTLKSRMVPIKKSADNKVYDEYEVQGNTPDTFIECFSKRAWNVMAASFESSTHALVIGRKERYSSGIFSSIVNPNTTLLMLVEQGAASAYRNIGYAWGDKDIASEWKERDFKVGGPSSPRIKDLLQS
ncbi:hypothetical protein P7C71_g4664, partial [Lecanoromycetidae sp. Uapishka_2]